MNIESPSINLSWLRETMKADWSANIFLKSRIVLIMFRLGHYLACRSAVTRAIGVPYFVVYKFMLEWIFGLEIPLRTRIGQGFTIYHGFGLVIHGKATIGNGVKIRHGVTLGNKILSDGTLTLAPSIGNGVEFGANATVLGPIRVGDDAVIGAGAVVTKDVPSRAIVAGVPAVQIGVK